MTKYLLQSILIATVLVAGIFAFMPVEEAKAVHTTIQGTQLNTAIVLTGCSADLAGTPLIVTSDRDFIVHYIFTAVTDAGTITVADGVGGAADFVITTILDGTVSGTLAYEAGTTTFTGDDANTDGCVTVVSESGQTTLGIA